MILPEHARQWPSVEPTLGQCIVFAGELGVVLVNVCGRVMCDLLVPDLYTDHEDVSCPGHHTADPDSYV